MRAFRDAIYCAYPRTIAGETWTEIAPFSFAGLNELAPAARRVEPEIPDDPYDLSAWPVRTVEDERAEIRYQMHTRNLELIDFLRPLARALPSLTFTLTDNARLAPRNRSSVPNTQRTWEAITTLAQASASDKAS